MPAGDRPKAPPTQARPKAGRRAARLPGYYTRQYCEENVWHLCQDPTTRADDAHAVFISNAYRVCPFWMQRAAPTKRAPVFWDYYVVLLGRHDDWKVWDLDSWLPYPVDALEYLRETFRPDRRVPARLHPRFRVVPRPTFLETFASDRSHMLLDDGTWRAPPPRHPPIRTADETMNLPRFVDPLLPFVGRVLDLAGLRDWLSPEAAGKYGKPHDRS